MQEAPPRRTIENKNYGGRHRRTRGQILLMLALALPLLLVMLGLALDGSRLYFERRHIQIAADAGARGGAYELFRGHITQARVDEASRTDAALNGYDNDDAAISVSAVIGPTGYTNDFVRVTITDEVPTTLLKIFGKDLSTVAASAVAGAVPDLAPPCVLALNEETEGAIRLSGASTELFANCKVMSNSDHQDSIVSNGGPCVWADAIGFVGPGSAAINGNNCLNPQPAGQAIPEQDPYAYLTPIDEIDMSAYPTISHPKVTINEGNYTFLSPLQPGIYYGGIQFVSLVSAFSVYMDPGVYFVNGLQMTGNVTVTGEGITIVDMCGGGSLNGIDIQGTATVYLSAPTEGPWKNILFYSACDADITGTAQSTFEGVMYFPDGNISFGGNQQTETFSMIIGDTITFGGTPLLNVDYGAANRTADLFVVTLVE